MMKIAIPLFGERTSPRFDCAQGFLLAVVKNDQVIERQELLAAGWTPPERVKRLIDSGVDTLICGGIDEVSARRLISYGVKIYSWVTGEAEDALSSLLKGGLESGIMVGSGGRRRGRWKFRRSSEHRGSGRRGHGKGRGRSHGGGRGCGWGGGRS